MPVVKDLDLVRSPILKVRAIGERGGETLAAYANPHGRRTEIEISTRLRHEPEGTGFFSVLSLREAQDFAYGILELVDQACGDE